MNRSWSLLYIVVVAATAASLLAGRAEAQAPTAAPPAPTAAPPAPTGVPPATAPADTPAAPAASSPLEQLAWLRGCWAGKVERFEFHEQWSPLRGGMMVGMSQTIAREAKKSTDYKTQDYTYLRLEARNDGVYYVAIPSGKKESAFKLSSVTEDRGKMAYTFTSPADAFPQRIVYLRGSEGWLYAQVAGKVGDQPKVVTYPMRHVDCATGAVIAG